MEQPVEITNRRGQVLRGVLHTPTDAAAAATRNAQGLPMVVLFHGFCDDRDEINFVHVELSRRLAQAGIASVRFDFAGSGESDGSFFDMTISGEVADGIDILTWARGLDFVDESRVAIHGLSLGGCVASMVAGTCPGQVRALSMFCPAPDVVYNMQNHMTLCGIDASDVREKGYIDVEGLKLGVGFYEDCLALDPFATAARYTGPVNTVHGSADTTASCACSERYQQLFGQRCTYLVVPGAEHRFKSVEWRAARINSALAFLQQHLAR